MKRAMYRARIRYCGGPRKPRWLKSYLNTFFNFG